MVPLLLTATWMLRESRLYHLHPPQTELLFRWAVMSKDRVTGIVAKLNAAEAVPAVVPK